MPAYDASTIKIFLRLLFISVLIFIGCNDPSKIAEDKATRRDAENCSFCGTWKDTGYDRIMKISPEKITIDFKIRKLTCRSECSEWKATGSKSGFIFGSNLYMECENSAQNKRDEYRVSYHLREYTLTLGEDTEDEAIYIKSGVSIQNQSNPLVGKWRFIPFDTIKEFKETLRNEQTPKDELELQFRDKFSVLNKRTYFVKQYIVEADRIIVVFGQGKFINCKIIEDGFISIQFKELKDIGLDRLKVQKFYKYGN